MVILLLGDFLSVSHPYDEQQLATSILLACTSNLVGFSHKISSIFGKQSHNAVLIKCKTHQTKWILEVHTLPKMPAKILTNNRAIFVGRNNAHRWRLWKNPDCCLCVQDYTEKLSFTNFALFKNMQQIEMICGHFDAFLSILSGNMWYHSKSLSSLPPYSRTSLHSPFCHFGHDWESRLEEILVSREIKSSFFLFFYTFN